MRVTKYFLFGWLFYLTEKVMRLFLASLIKQVSRKGKKISQYMKTVVHIVMAAATPRYGSYIQNTFPSPSSAATKTDNTAIG